MKPSTSSWLGVLLAVGVFVAAMGVEFLTVNVFLKAKEIESWPATKGTILKSELTSTFHGTTTYEAQIEYEYQVGEEKYLSKQVRTRGTGTKHQVDVARLVQKFPAGQEVDVYYDPANPSDAYLETGVDFVNYIIIVSPLIFALGAVVCLVAMLREKLASGTNHATESYATTDRGWK
ncbi:DUF3592 domain-containing protein [Anatilimnocola sp. NA78]|uniref:DUF3592 domain-containing protein n=1 Tax=Anatilimnocola sp. NA78 TaxID=3415683 RepID=UPI003CE5B1A6